MEIVHNLGSKYAQDSKETANGAGRLCEVPTRSGLSPPKHQQHLRVCRMIAALLGALGSLLISPFVGDNHLFSSEQPPQNAG